MTRRICLLDDQHLTLSPLPRWLYLTVFLFAFGLGAGLMSLVPYVLRIEAAQAERNRVELERYKTESMDVRQALNSIGAKLQ